MQSSYKPLTLNHALQRTAAGRHGNWRVTFTFKDGHAYVLDYEDYH